MRKTLSNKVQTFKARQRKGDIERISRMTPYSVSHVSNVLNGYRSLNRIIVDTAYEISYRRKRNSELVNS